MLEKYDTNTAQKTNSNEFTDVIRQKEEALDLKKKKENLVDEMVVNYLKEESESLDAPNEQKLIGTFNICSDVLSPALKAVFKNADDCINVAKKPQSSEEDLLNQISTLQSEIQDLQNKENEINQKINQDQLKFDLRTLRKTLVANMFITSFFSVNLKEAGQALTVAKTLPRDINELGSEYEEDARSLLENFLGKALSISLKVIIEDGCVQFGPIKGTGVDEAYLVDLASFLQKITEMKIPTFDKIGKLVPAVGVSELSKSFDEKSICKILKDYNGFTEFSDLKHIEQNQTVEGYLTKQGFAFGTNSINYGDIRNKITQEESIIIVLQDKNFYCCTHRSKGPEQDISILKPVLCLAKNNYKIFYKEAEDTFIEIKL